MVYDSRSGSTLLSRKLSESLKDVAVTPEIGFDSLLKQSRTSFSLEQARAVVRELYASGDFRNIGVEPLVLEVKLSAIPEPISKADLIGLTLILWQEASGMAGSNIIVKNGTHALYWREISMAMKESARFIFVYRDPRAVINSKLRTLRPYHGHEVMAWGGSLLAALRWRRYSSIMRMAAKAGLEVLEVKYEFLLPFTEREVTRVAEFLDTEAMLVKEVGNYVIPEAERNIHTLVSAGEIKTERGEAWMHELSVFDRNVIESLCMSEMSSRGYAPVDRHGKVFATLCIIAALPGTLLKVARHFSFLFVKHAR